MSAKTALLKMCEYTVCIGLFSESPVSNYLKTSSLFTDLFVEYTISKIFQRKCYVTLLTIGWHLQSCSAVDFSSCTKTVFTINAYPVILCVNGAFHLLWN